MGKTECGEPSKPATTIGADHPTDQNSANANGLPGILADLTPLLGPMQAEQLAQFLRNISAPQQNQEPEKKEAKEEQPEQQLQEQLGQLGGLISTFLGPTAVEAAFPVLDSLAKAGHLTQEPVAEEEKEKKKDIEPEIEM